MPYLKCPRCDLTTYVARGRAATGECPRCATVLHAPRRRFDRDAPWGLDRGALFDDGILGALALARRQLDMDLAFLGELAGRREILRWLSGDAGSFGFGEGMALPIVESFCRHAGEDGAFVAADARADPLTRDLRITARAGIGAYVGVEIERVEGRRHVLCCVAHAARPGLGAADVRFLRGVGETVLATLEARAASDRALPRPA